MLYVKQNDLLYEPSDRVDSAHLNTQVFELKGESIRVHVQNPAQKNALIYFGGNAENVADISLKLAGELPNYSCYFVNYRGYGGSSGQPSEAGICNDALALFDVLDEKFDSISVLGRSLGSGVATFLAARRKVKHLALMTPYDSIVNIARIRFPYYPLAWLLKDQYRSFEQAENIRARTLVLIAEWDGFIPMKSSLNLVKHFTQNKPSLKVIPKVGHNSILLEARLYAELKAFLNV